MASWVVQVLPVTKTPLRHSKTVEAPPGRIVPLASTPTGLRTVLSVTIWMSNPLSGSEPAIRTETFRVPLTSTTDSRAPGAGHVVLELRQTFPVSACTGEMLGTTKSAANMITGSVSSMLSFFKSCTRIFPRGLSGASDIRVFETLTIHL